MMPGTIGKYQVLRRLAEGGMAEIFLCTTTGTFAQRCVVKRILPHLARDPAFVDMFLDEVRLAATLHHPQIASVFDFGTDGDAPFFVMELLRGHDLRAIEEVLEDRDEAMPHEHVVTIGIGVCAGLHHAHELRDPRGAPLELVHRDVSPHNIFVTVDGHVKLCDFGIAKSAGQRTVTEAGTVKGKLRYLSPEQCRAERLDRRTDIFALSIVLWELLAGRPLYDGTDLEILTAIAAAPPPPPSSVRAGVPAGLEAIVMRGLAQRREDRWPTAQALQLALEAWAREERVASSPIGVAHWLRDRLGAPSVDGDAPHPTEVPASRSPVTLPYERTQARVEPTTAEKPAFSLPARFEVTDLEGAPTLPPLPNAAVRFGPGAPDESPLELERPPAIEPVIRRRSPLVPILVLVGIAAAGIGGWQALAHRTPEKHDVEIELAHAPPGTRLLLDGAPIVGTHLVLPRSTERHAVEVLRIGKQPKMIPFTADKDATIDLSR